MENAVVVLQIGYCESAAGKVLKGFEGLVALLWPLQGGFDTASQSPGGLNAWCSWCLRTQKKRKNRFISKFLQVPACPRCYRKFLLIQLFSSRPSCSKKTHEIFAEHDNAIIKLQHNNIQFLLSFKYFTSFSLCSSRKTWTKHFSYISVPVAQYFFKIIIAIIMKNRYLLYDAFVLHSVGVLHDANIVPLWLLDAKDIV